MMGLRAYAQHRNRLGLPGGALNSVQVAIKTGRLASSLTADGKKIRSAKAADLEWAATTNADRAPLTGPTGPKGSRGKAKTKPNGTPSRAEPMSLAEARARRESANAELAEIELEEKKASLLPARDVEAAMADAYLRSRTKIFGVGPRLREKHPATPPAVLDDLDLFLREALEELAGPVAG